MKVHVLHEGWACCGAGRPTDWPLDKWIAFNEPDPDVLMHVDCAECLLEAAAHWPERFQEDVMGYGFRTPEQAAALVTVTMECAVRRGKLLQVRVLLSPCPENIRPGWWIAGDPTAERRDFDSVSVAHQPERLAI